MRREDHEALIDVPRSLWDPTEGRHRRHGERPLAAILGSEVHWVGTGEPGDHGDTGTELLSFEQFHEETKGWEDLFYNDGLDTQGFIYEGRDATIASQSNLRAWRTLLVVVGDGDTLTTTEADAIRAGIWRHWTATTAGLRDPSRLRSHQERSATACPGIVQALMEDVRSGRWTPPAHKPLPRPTPEPIPDTDEDDDTMPTQYFDPETEDQVVVWRDDTEPRPCYDVLLEKGRTGKPMSNLLALGRLHWTKKG